MMKVVGATPFNLPFGRLYWKIHGQSHERETTTNEDAAVEIRAEPQNYRYF
jgi:hypothetical protein